MILIKSRLVLGFCLLAAPLAGLTGCNKLPDHLNVVDFDFRGDIWNPSDLFSDPQVIALAKAIKKGDTQKIDKLVAQGVDVNARGKDDVTPLGWALMVKNKASFKQLLRNGADPNHRVWERIPLIEIAAGDETDSEWLRLCLEYRGDPNVVNRLEGIPHGRQTPIYSALKSRQRKSVELLIKAGANLNHLDDGGSTPLRYALFERGFKVADDLLMAGADFRVRDEYGQDFLFDVIVSQPIPSPNDEIWEGREKVLDFLEEHGAEFDAAEAVVAKSNPEALPAWEQDKQRRAANKKSGAK